MSQSSNNELWFVQLGSGQSFAFPVSSGWKFANGYLSVFSTPEAIPEKTVFCTTESNVRFIKRVKGNCNVCANSIDIGDGPLIDCKHMEEREFFCSAFCPKEEE